MRRRAMASASPTVARRMINSATSPRDDRFDRGYDVFDGDVEIFEEHRAGCRRAEGIDTDYSAARIVDGPDVLAPEGGDPSLDRNPRHVTRQDARAIRRVLLIENA